MLKNHSLYEKKNKMSTKDQTFAKSRNFLIKIDKSICSKNHPLYDKKTLNINAEFPEDRKTELFVHKPKLNPAFSRGTIFWLNFESGISFHTLFLLINFSLFGNRFFHEPMFLFLFWNKNISGRIFLSKNSSVFSSDEESLLLTADLIFCLSKLYQYFPRKKSKLYRFCITPLSAVKDLTKAARKNWQISDFKTPWHMFRCSVLNLSVRIQVPQLKTVTSIKTTLADFDNMRVIFKDGDKTLSYGHKTIERH